MTASRMGDQYLEEAEGRMDLVRLAAEKGRFAATVREAQECVEPSKIHDVSEILRRERNRFPAWFQSDMERLAVICQEMAANRGLAYYGDETAGKGPQELFDEADARKAVEEMEFVAAVCLRLRSRAGS